MDEAKKLKRRDKIRIGVYSSSWRISTTALIVVASLEVFMLVYTLVDLALFGPYINEYRTFYVALLTLAVAYIALNFFVKRDIDHRYKLLSVANPFCAVFFFAWSLGITYFDAIKFGTVDPTVFMTFSLTVPLSFFLFPIAYTAIALIADIFMVYMAVTVTGSMAPFINISIYCIFQVVLGISFLRLRLKLTERIVEEQENADIDVLTGFSNRRVYEKDVKGLAEKPLPDDFAYVSIDLNELKETNDSYGHEAGDKLIIGAAECMAKCFGDKGKTYRIGGDEFVGLISAGQGEVEALLNDYEQCLKTWSANNGITLTAAYGYVCHSEYPDAGIAELASMADKRMYASKARYYQQFGKDRRRY